MKMMPENLKKARKFEELLKAFSIGDISLGSNKMIGYGDLEWTQFQKACLTLQILMIVEVYVDGD